jgi:RNA polymerase sigma-70 factor (ECF subfamily)
MDNVVHLLQRARQGDSEALSVLYRQFLPGIFGYIATRVPERTIAEDLTSEVFLQMVEGIHALRAGDEAGFAAWLLRIARVTVAGYYRKRERQPQMLSLPNEDAQGEALPFLETHPETNPVFQAETREDWKRVVQAINHLTEEQRQVLVGRLIMGYDVETVARMIGKKGNAVKALQFRALQSLHRLLAKQSGSEHAHQRQKEEVR